MAKILVLDGSNISYNGRNRPTLEMLMSAIDSLHAKYADATLVPFVDATLRHKLARNEQDRFKSLSRAGTVTEVPAGTVGRGDAFMLQHAAERLADGEDVVVVSNDSFRDEIDQHPWLADDGRVLGGAYAAGRWTWHPRALRRPAGEHRSPVGSASSPAGGPVMAAVGFRDTVLELWRIEDGVLQHRWSDHGQWSDWHVEELPEDAPAAAVTGAAHATAMDLWVLTGAGQLLHRWWTPQEQWTQWQDWGAAAPPLAAASAADNHLEVWAVRDGRLQHTWYVDGWAGYWQDV